MPRLQTRKARRANRKQRGGTIPDVCIELLPSNRRDQTTLGGMKMKKIEEDSIKIGTPEQILCYGNAITSCTTISIVLENNWKIGIHMNPASHMLLKDQIINPLTAIPMLQLYLRTHPEFVDNPIKKIYVQTERPVLILQSFKTSINNNVSAIQGIPEESDQIMLTDGNARTFFQECFGSEVVTATTEIRVILGAEVQYSRTRVCRPGCPNGPDHMFILEDGTLDLVSDGRRL